MPVLAQDMPPMNAQICAQSWDVLAAHSTFAPDVAIAVEGGDCLLRDLTVPVDSLRAHIAELRWRLTGFEALAAGGLLSQISVNATGVYVVPNIENLPVMEYVLFAQARAHDPITISISATQDNGNVRLSQFHIDFPGDNAIELQTTLTGVTPNDPTQIRLHHARVAVETNGLFEAHALMPLANLLLRPDAPIEPQVEMARRMGIGAIMALPDGIMSQDSRAELTRFVQDLPNPAGELTLELSAPNGVALDAAMQAAHTPSRLVAIFDGHEILARYRPSEH